VRIGLISQEYPPETAKGGISTQSYLKAYGLTALGHKVRVISRSLTKHKTEHMDDGVCVIRVPSTSMPVYTELADWLTYSKCVAEEIALQHAKEPFDILEFPEWACEGYVHLLNRSEWNRIPTVLQLHGPLAMLGQTLGWPDPDSDFFRIGTQMECTTLQLADAVFSSSACSANWCASQYGLDKDQIPIMHTGVDTDLFRPTAVAKATDPTIVFVGKMVLNKGVDVLVEACCEIAPDFPNLRLRLLGGGEEAVIASLREKVGERGLDQMLEIPGYIDRFDLPDQLSRAHLFAAPSKYEGGPGFVYLEAMACGLPVIACSGSGAAEVVRHEHNGLLVAPDDLSDLVDALRRLLSDVDEREAMSSRAMDYVQENANSQTRIRELESFYAQVIGKYQAKHGHNL
jgi:glycosyltransferase involved in cell wall biosynthesis